MMSEKLAVMLVMLLILPTIGCSRILHNAKIVNHNPTLIRSSYPTKNFLDRVHHGLKKEGGIKLIVNLTCNSNREEMEFVLRNQISSVTMCWSARRKPPRESIEYLIEIFKDKNNYPMLIHCAYGADRTGLAVALWRIENNGSSPEKAIFEMKWFGHFYKRYPEMQKTIIERYQLENSRLWASTFLYLFRDALMLPKYIIDNLIFELKLQS